MGEDSIRGMRKNRNKSSGLAIYEQKKQEWVFSRIEVSNLQISSSSSTEIHLLPETSPKQFLTVLIRLTTTDTPLSSREDQIFKTWQTKNKAMCCLPEAEKHEKQLHYCRSWYRYLGDNSVWNQLCGIKWNRTGQRIWQEILKGTQPESQRLPRSFFLLIN